MAHGTMRGKQIEKMISVGMHLVRCAADKKALDIEWQKVPWNGSGEGAILIAFIPGRSNLAVVDVDVPKGQAAADGETVESRACQVIDLLGTPDLELETLSGGRHLYYGVAPQYGGAPILGNRKLVVGDLRCDSGYVVLWGEARDEVPAWLDGPPQARWTRSGLLSALEPLLRGSVRRSDGDSGSTLGVGSGSGGRGRTEGDRNDGAFIRARSAVENDDDPVPAIASAIADAIQGGHSPWEAVTAAFRGAGYGAEVRPEVPADASEMAGVVARWRAESARVLVSREHPLAVRALQRIEAIVRSDPGDAVRRMREIAAVWDAGGDEGVRAWYRSLVEEHVHDGIDWDASIEPDWFVPGWVPRDRVTPLYAEGGVGKTHVGVQLAVAKAAGLGHWIPGSSWVAPGVVLDGQAGRVLFLSWEDTPRAMRRLVHHAGKALGLEDVRSAVEGRLDFRYVGGMGSIWAPGEGSRHIGNLATLTAAGHWLSEQMAKYELVVLDPLAAVYASDENQRGMVRAFVGAMDGLCQQHGCTMLVLAHSSKEQVVSGSTDWKNAVRVVLVLEAVKRKVRPPEGQTGTWPVEQVGVRLYAEKMNEAVKPSPVWLDHGKDHRGWIGVERPTDG